MSKATPQINLSKLIKRSPNKKVLPIEIEVATCLHDMAQTGATFGEAAHMEFLSAVEIPINGQPDKKVVLIAFPYKIFMTYVRRSQNRLISELEKKLKRFVVCYAKRRIIKSSNIKSAGMKILPRSRTRSAVQEAILEDIVAPIEIVGKRLRVRTDGSEIRKIFLDPKEKNFEDKVEAFSEAYKKLTNKVAIFTFES